MKKDERREKKVAVPPVNQYLYPVFDCVEIELHAPSLGLRKPSGAILPAGCQQASSNSPFGCLLLGRHHEGSDLCRSAALHLSVITDNISGRGEVPELNRSRPRSILQQGGHHLRVALDPLLFVCLRASNAAPTFPRVSWKCWKRRGHRLVATYTESTRKCGQKAVCGRRRVAQNGCKALGSRWR